MKREIDIQKTLASLRANLLYFGIDTSKYDDKELVDIIVNGSREIAKHGITSQDAAQSFMKMSQALRESEATNEQR